MKLKENKEQSQKIDTRNYVVRLLAYVHGRRQKKNILLVKRSYKYCSILAHFQNPIHSNSQNTKIRAYNFKLSKLSLNTRQLFSKLDKQMRECVPLFIAKILATIHIFFLNYLLLFKISKFKVRIVWISRILNLMFKVWIFRSLNLIFKVWISRHPILTL